ncbi:hypothetical protein ACKKBG_A37665 [Auxenochlorella protothecoides x Auxenochlorella symbiontica]
MLLVARRLLGSSVVNHAVLARLNGEPAGASTLVGATDTSLVVISLATSGSSAVLCQQHLPFVVLGLQATPMGHTQDAICMLADAGFVEIMAYDAEANRLVTLVRHALAGPTLNPWVHLAAARGRGVVAVASVTQQIAVLALTGPGSGAGGDWALQPLAWGGLGVDDVIAGLALTDSGEWLAVLSLVGPDSQELHSAALDAGAASARRGAPLPRLAFQLDAEWFAQDAWIWGLHPGPPSRPHTLLLRYESCAMLCAPRRGQRAAVLAHYRPYWAGGTRLWGHAAVAGLAWQPGGEALYLASFDGRLSLAGGPAASAAPARDGAVPVFTGRPKRVDAAMPGEVHALLLPAAEGPFVWLALGGGVVVAANRTDRPLIPGGLGPVAGASLGLEEGRPLLWAVGQAATEGPLAHVTQVRVAESAAPGAGGDEDGRPPWVLNGAWPYPTGDARERVVLSFGAGTCVKLLTGEGELEDASQGLAFDADAPTLAFGALPGLWPVQVTASAVLAVLVGRSAPRPAWRPPVGSSIAVAAVVTAGDAVVLQTAGCRDLLVLRPGLGTGPGLVQEVRLPLEAEVSCLGAACAAPGGGLLLPFGTHAPSVGAVRFVPGELPALAWSAPLAAPLAALRCAGLAGDDDQRAPVESVALLPAAARGQAALCVLGTRAGLLLVLELGPGAGGALRPQSALRLGRGPVRLAPLPPDGAGGADPGPGALVLGAQAHVLRRGPGPVGRATLRALGVQGAALALPLAGGGFLAGMGDGRVARVTTLAGAPWRVESRLVEARALHDAGRRALVLGGWDPRTTGAALQALSPEAGEELATWHGFDPGENVVAVCDWATGVSPHEGEAPGAPVQHRPWHESRDGPGSLRSHPILLSPRGPHAESPPPSGAFAVVTASAAELPETQEFKRRGSVRLMALDAEAGAFRVLAQVLLPQRPTAAAVMREEGWAAGPCLVLGLGRRLACWGLRAGDLCLLHSLCLSNRIDSLQAEGRHVLAGDVRGGLTLLRWRDEGGRGAFHAVAGEGLRRHISAAVFLTHAGAGPAPGGAVLATGDADGVLSLLRITRDGDGSSRLQRLGEHRVGEPVVRLLALPVRDTTVAAWGGPAAPALLAVTSRGTVLGLTPAGDVVHRRTLERVHARLLARAGVEARVRGSLEYDPPAPACEEAGSATCEEAGSATEVGPAGEVDAAGKTAGYGSPEATPAGSCGDAAPEPTAPAPDGAWAVVDGDLMLAALHAPAPDLEALAGEAGVASAFLLSSILSSAVQDGGVELSLA